MGSRKDRAAHTKLLPRVLYPRRQHAALCLALAAFAFSLRALTLVMPPVHRVTRSTTDAIASDARKLGVLLDGALIRARERAEGLAGSPVLQAGVVTDAATLADIVKTEYRIESRRRETLELFQVRGRAIASLVRIPSTAAPIAIERGTRARIADRDGLTIIATAAVTPYTDTSDVSGIIAVAVAIDLSPLSLARTTAGAHLVGAGTPVAVVAERAAGDATLVVPVPLDPRWQLGTLSLHTAPVAAAQSAPWLLPVRYAALGLGVVFLTAFFVALRGNRRR